MREISEKRYQKLLRCERQEKRFNEIMRKFPRLSNNYDATPKEVVENSRPLTYISREHLNPS